MITVALGISLKTHRFIKVEKEFGDQYADPKPKVFKFTAYCTSYACTKSEDHKTVEKKVSKHESFCPDCQNALFFERREVRG